MKNSLYLGLLLFFVLSCNKTKELNELQQETSKIERSTFEELGIKHNFAIKEIFHNLPLDEEIVDMYNYSINQQKEILPEEYIVFEKTGIKRDEKLISLIRKPFASKENFIDYFSQLEISSELKTTLALMSEIMMDETVNVREKNFELIKLEELASKTLSDSDLVILYSATSVGKYSTLLWAPKHLGGEDFLKSNSRMPFNWVKTALADAAGVVAGAAGAVAASGGAAAIPNPAFGGVPTAGVVGVIAGVGASAQSAISDL